MITCDRCAKDMSQTSERYHTYSIIKDTIIHHYQFCRDCITKLHEGESKVEETLEKSRTLLLENWFNEFLHTCKYCSNEILKKEKEGKNEININKGR